MLVLFLSFIGLSAIIVFAGAFLAKFGDVIAIRSGLGGSLVGLILIAAATSLPELAVNCMAVRIPATDLALGSIVGSSLFNLLILGLMDFVHGSRDRIISAASRGHALSALASLIVTALLAFFILAGDPALAGWLGLGPIVIFLTYLFCLRLIFVEQMGGLEEDDEDLSEMMSMNRAVWGYVLMTALIFLAARFLAPTADAIATRSGLGGTFVGTTFVAITTSLPELVTTFAAVRIGALDLAIGNVFGSNAFNASMLLPMDACYTEGVLLQAASPVHAMTATAVILVTAVVMTGMFWSPGKVPGRAGASRNMRWLEPNAGMIVVLALAGIAAVYFVST